jgi:hypothetical protein
VNTTKISKLWKTLSAKKAFAITGTSSAAQNALNNIFGSQGDDFGQKSDYNTAVVSPKRVAL